MQFKKVLEQSNLINEVNDLLLSLKRDHIALGPGYKDLEPAKRKDIYVYIAYRKSLKSLLTQILKFAPSVVSMMLSLMINRAHWSLILWTSHFLTPLTIC